MRKDKLTSPPACSVSRFAQISRLNPQGEAISRFAALDIAMDAVPAFFITLTHPGVDRVQACGLV